MRTIPFPGWLTLVLLVLLPLDSAAYDDAAALKGVERGRGLFLVDLADPWPRLRLVDADLFLALLRSQ